MPSLQPFYMTDASTLPLQALNARMRDIFRFSSHDLSAIALHDPKAVNLLLQSITMQSEQDYVLVVVYLNVAMCTQDAPQVLGAYKTLLKTYNELLTNKARELMTAKLKNGQNDISQADKLGKIFEAKKEIAKHWYALHASEPTLGPLRIDAKSVCNAIDQLKQYTLNDVPGKQRGRYLQAEEYLRWGTTGFSRTEKLRDVLSYCDALVLSHPNARKPPEKPPSLDNGRLKNYVSQFFELLKTFFQTFQWKGKIGAVSLGLGLGVAGAPPSTPTKPQPPATPSSSSTPTKPQPPATPSRFWARLSGRSPQDAAQADAKRRGPPATYHRRG